MIISASRRTDIPAFYSCWFMNRLKAGFALVPNPFNPRQLSRVSLHREDVDAIVFWTRNPQPLLPHLKELDAQGYRYYFQYTVTGYPQALEPSTPPPQEAVDSFILLSEKVGADRVLWRYDPLLICNLMDMKWHLDNFSQLATALRERTKRVTISPAIFYRKTIRNLAQISGLEYTDIVQDTATMHKLISELVCIANSNDIKPFTCATNTDFTDLGAYPGKCIDDKLLFDSFGIRYPPTKDKGQRPSCRCAKSCDIGQYSTCLHRCAYCYATEDFNRGKQNNARHDPASPLLVGQEPETTPDIGPRQMKLF